MEKRFSPLLRPTPGKWVLAAGVNGSGQQIIIRAMWIPQYFMRGDDTDCDEKMESDCYGRSFWPKGWYEKCEATGINHLIDFPVLKWTDLPHFPEG